MGGVSIGVQQRRILEHGAQARVRFGDLISD
jgi:hypothetical protein